MSDFAPDDAAPPGGRWRTLLMVVVALLGAGVLAALIVTTGQTARLRDRATQLQSHSYEVMILARTLSGTIAGAEASLGRFVISGDKQLGRQFAAQWQLGSQQIDRLDQVTDDNQAQQPRIDALRTAYRARGEQLGLIALNTNYGQNPQALSRYWQARRGRALETIDHQLDAIIGDERALLAERSRIVADRVDQSNAAARVLAIFGILLVLAAIGLGWTTVQALAERAVARSEADTQRGRAAELETAVANATDQLRDEVRERLDAEAQLRQAQKIEAVGQLTGGIAHDFNNMLAVVLGGLELAKRNLADPVALMRNLDRATEGANRAATLTRRLLAFARSEPLRPEAVEPRALIAGMAELVDRTLGDGVTVETSDDGAAWRVWIDRHQLENALLNLAVNARDAMDGRGRLTVVTGGRTLAANEIGSCPGGDYATIAVTDTGAGMTPEVLERAFEPFFTTKPVGQGTGLGLSQIFGFVRQSKGEIAIDSVPGTGTTVTLYLPRHHPAAERAAAPVPRVEGIAATHQPLSILVVEDDPRVLATTMSALAELGHAPVACGDPLAAAELLASMPAPDLILSDVVMPGRSGPELIAALQPHYPHLGVLFVTGYAGELPDSASFGGHAVLRKPFTMNALHRAIEEAMADRPERSRAA